MPREGGLADQDPGERAGAVHVRVGHEPQFLELVGLQEVRLIDDEHDGAVPFGGLGGEQVGGLGHQLGFEVAGLGAEGPDDLHVEAAGAEGGVGDVDDLVPGGVQAGDGGADRDRLACLDVAGNHPEQGFGDAEADPGGCLGVGLPGGQVPGGDRLPERGAGQPEMRRPRRTARHRCRPRPAAASAAG